jgi:hypothetical protein
MIWTLQSAPALHAAQASERVRLRAYYCDCFATVLYRNGVSLHYCASMAAILENTVCYMIARR